MPETIVAPIAQTGVVLPTQTGVIPSTPSTSLTETPSNPTTPSTKATPEARQAREFQRHQPEKFYGGMNLEAAEIFLRSHEKIHDILATPAHMQPSISFASLFGEADVWWRTTVATKGKPRDWAEFKERFEQKYIPPTVCNLKRTEFQNIRHRADESVMQYMDRYLRLMEYAGGAADTDADQAYYFVHGLLDSIGSMVVTTAPSTLQAAYERAMDSEGFGSTRTGAQAISSAPSQSGRPSGDGRKRKRFRQWSQRDRAHSVASVASPPTAAVVSSAPARSYASVQPPLVSVGQDRQQASRRTEGRGGGQEQRYRQGQRRDQGQGQSSGQAPRQGQRGPLSSGSQRGACFECGQLGHFISACPRLGRGQPQSREQVHAIAAHRRDRSRNLIEDPQSSKGKAVQLGDIL
ncbi:hypothetical protein Sjap_004092 [Stephania japonica]|uniref:CCHC-type domain-containing protein n=1 Tax=Stephania japonica TaxID=461633 RepID=A0AAP0PIR0_9MAGN